MSLREFGHLCIKHWVRVGLGVLLTNPQTEAEVGEAQLTRPEIILEESGKRIFQSKDDDKLHGSKKRVMLSMRP
ncbi:hypothetical protein Tco_0230920 [Tanacetum coccineum]